MEGFCLHIVASEWLSLKHLQEPTFEETIIFYAQINSEIDTEITSSSGTVKRPLCSTSLDYFM